MAQKVTGYVKLQIPAGKATPAPPVGPALGQHGVNIAAFTKEFNERTKNDMGMIIPVVITVYADRSFTFITKTPPAAVLIKKALQHRVRLRRPQQGPRSPPSPRPTFSKIAEMQDARPERRFHRGRYEHDRRYCPLHGRCRRRIRRV